MQKLRYTQVQDINILKIMQRCSRSSNTVKPKLKKRIPWETAKICQKRDTLHKAAHLKEISPTQMNINNYINSQENNYINKKIYEIQKVATNK